MMFESEMNGTVKVVWIVWASRTCSDHSHPGFSRQQLASKARIQFEAMY